MTQFVVLQSDYKKTSDCKKWMCAPLNPPLARKLTKVCGKLISTKFVMGNIATGFEPRTT